MGWRPNYIEIPKGTLDFGLFFLKKNDLTMVGYADAGYLSDPYNARSQTGFVFLCGGTAISWQLLALLSLNELLRKRTETDVAFTLKHSRVSNPRGTIKRDQT